MLTAIATYFASVRRWKPRPPKLTPFVGLGVASMSVAGQPPGIGKPVDFPAILHPVPFFSDRLPAVARFHEMHYGGGRTYTVITSQRGPLAGRRIVRGRELGCAADYQSPNSVTSPSSPPTPPAAAGALA